MINFQEELYCQYVYEMAGVFEHKDILIIVHDQIDFVKPCIDSLYLNTNNFTLYLWDNNSMAPTREYLEELAKTNNNVVLVRNSENIGFIKPNNELSKLGTSPYIILLNSDTEVSKGWDTALIGWMKNNNNCAIVGYQGGTLDADGKGLGGSVNGKFDYVCGWCLCMKRNIYEKLGLFDEKNLTFAYGEDSDLSLRMKEQGFDIHVLNIKLVKHYGNVTSMEVSKEMDMSVTFLQNHKYIKTRWQHYLKNERVSLTT